MHRMIALLTLASAPVLAGAASDLATPGASGHVDAKAAKGMFRDKEDGRFDMSNWLLEHHGFMPVPIIVTDPAVGYGGGIALTFFHRPKGAPITRTGADGKQQMVPPNILGVMGLKTENGSKAYGAGGMLHFRDDTWRYKGGVGDTDMNIVMTGAGGIVELQGTAEGAPFSRRELDALIHLAERGIRELVAAQQSALGQ